MIAPSPLWSCAGIAVPLLITSCPTTFLLSFCVTMVRCSRFLYKVTTVAGVPLEMNIINAGDVCVASNDDAVRWATYGGFWQARASYDYKCVVAWFSVAQ